MAESKNNFLGGKMNKDFDSRLLKPNEYRDALNITVGKSENNSVGSIQNILGNEQLKKPSSTGTVPFEDNTNLVCIGYFVDNDKRRIYQFLTDYVDPTPSEINLPPSNREMKITVYDQNNTGNPYITLVEGAFLNLSTTNIITGVNLVENLLFWTDNRNQPRKINIDLAISNSVESGNPYYTNSEQLSVAKYAPFISPELYTTEIINEYDVYDSFEGSGGFTILKTFAENNIQPGDQLISQVNGIAQTDLVFVTNVNIIGGAYYIYITGTLPSLTGDLKFYRCTMNTSDNVSDINGNDNFLQDKFVRFSYRFRFDDNEYSLMAPFTQPTFIPNQKGFFINGDEDAAYRSTVLEWMENAVNQIDLLITLPDTGANISNVYKIKSMDILYKESDSLAIKVVETIPITTIQQESANSNIYTYTYKSQKPKKTLQESETLRVYDKVPIRALAQESAGNRIIYGNFVNQSTPPSTLNYNVTLVDKGNPYTPFTSWVEYPMHTIKQNRTYQVGVVLADKFGRQSSVILSSASPYVETGDTVFGSSSVFIPYKSENWTTNVRPWYGDQLVVVFNDQINSIKNETLGTPGLYATVSGVITGSDLGFEITAGVVDNSNPYTYTYTLQSVGTPQLNRPKVGNYLRGKYKDYVKVITASAGSLRTDGPISDVYNYNSSNTPDIKYSYSLNELGWYSYRVVVKQQEQEYYNVYVPGMLAGYPVNQTPNAFPLNEDNTTCHFVSINDNINKVPRDLSEVGPNQKQYRSSVQLWTRVENNESINRQYYPSNQPEVVNTIAQANDLNFLPISTTNPVGSATDNFYQFDTNPLINRVSTNSKVGTTGLDMTPVLGVFETNPTTSALDIFWETSTSGYISDLNADVLTGTDIIVSFSDLDFIYRENQDYNGIDPTPGNPSSPYITDWFYFRNSSGVTVLDIDNIILYVEDLNGTDVTSKFELEQDPGSLHWRIKITQSDYYFGINANTEGSFVFTFNITHTVSGTTYNPILTTASQHLRITNIVPEISVPSDGDMYNLTNDPLVGPFIDSIGNNGNVSAYETNYLANLYWSIENNEFSDYFSINNSTGDISILSNEIDYGYYDLNIKLKDSSTIDGLQTPTGNIPTTGPLSTNVNITFYVPEFSACGEWTSLSTEMLNPSPDYDLSVNAIGYINFWKVLRQGETIVNSTVKLTAFKLFDESTYYNIDVPLNVQFNNVNNPLNGYFDGWIYFSNNLSTKPAEVLRFEGYVVTSSGRSVYINFDSYASGYTSVPTGLQSSCSECTVSYIPNTCKQWTIYNNSNFPIRFNALNGNGKSIIGDIIPPNSWAKSIGEGGTYPVVRNTSISAMGNGVIGGVVTYTSTVSCPLV